MVTWQRGPSPLLPSSGVLEAGVEAGVAAKPPQLGPRLNRDHIVTNHILKDEIDEHRKPRLSSRWCYVITTVQIRTRIIVRIGFIKETNSRSYLESCNMILARP